MALVAGEVAELAWVADEFKRTRQDMDKNKNLVGDQQACKVLKHSSVTSRLASPCRIIYGLLRRVQNIDAGVTGVWS